jgi:hypothetical protein
MNHPHAIERWAFLISLFAALGTMVVAILEFGSELDQRWMATSSSLLGLSSIFQLRISGWFERFIETYSDIEKYPWGPPSHVTRELVREGELPRWWRRLKRFSFSNPNTGAGLGLASLAVGMGSIWM